MVKSWRLHLCYAYMIDLCKSGHILLVHTTYIKVGREKNLWFYEKRRNFNMKYSYYACVDNGIMRKQKLLHMPAMSLDCVIMKLFIQNFSSS